MIVEVVHRSKSDKNKITKIEKVIECDRCGKVLSEKDVYATIALKAMSTMFMNYPISSMKDQTWDLCLDCYEEFEQFMDSQDSKGAIL